MEAKKSQRDLEKEVRNALGFSTKAAIEQKRNKLPTPSESSVENSSDDDRMPNGHTRRNAAMQTVKKLHDQGT